MKTKGKYILDHDKNGVWSTNNFSVYYWYNQVFYGYDVTIDKEKSTHKKTYGKPIPANKNTIKTAIKQEISYYMNGYFPKLQCFVIKGKKKYFTRWVKDKPKSDRILKQIKERHPEFFKHCRGG